MAERKLRYKEVPQAILYVMRTLWRLSPSYVLLSFVATIKEKLIPFVTLFIAAEITTQLPTLVTNHNNIMTIIWLVVATVAVELGDRLIDIAIRTKQQRTEAIVNIGLREEFYTAYARLPYYLYENKEVLDAFQYADDFMSRFSRFGLQQITRAAGSVLEFFTAIIALTAVAWFMPLAFVIFLPFLILSVGKINRAQAQLFHENRGIQRRLWAMESLFYPRRIKETRLYNLVAYLLKNRRIYSQKIEQREIELRIKHDHSRFWQAALMELAGLFASIVAIWRIAFDGATLGVYVLASQLTSRANGAVSSFFTEISDFDKDLYGFAEYRYITETLQPEHHNLPMAPEKPAIKLDHITFTYPEAKKPTLRDINLEIPYGHSLAIVGENGAGKTTLTRILLGLYKPQKGAVLVAGTSLSDLDESSWLRRIGVLLQDFGMDEDITIRDSVWMGDITKPNDGKAIQKVINDVELTEVVAEAPTGLDTYIGKWIEKDNGIELSGGQLQRLAIARTLFREPDILILDEPTSAIDANAEERIFSHLVENRKDKTTIFISHRFSTVRRAEHIAFIERGELIEYGTHAELMKINGKYAKMFKTQAAGYLDS